MPSTTSSSNSRPLASSTVITPSLPTFSIASAIFSPTTVSPLAEITPTWLISFEPETGLERFLRSSTTFETAMSMPRLRSIGFIPAATDFMPSRTSAWADDAQNVAFLHDDQVFATDLDLGARPFAEQDAVARLDVERRHLALFRLGAGANSDDFAFLR